jgi:hydrogenase maturation protein HypF
MESRQTVEIRVRGTVQGVGFRPTVWRLACDEGLVGEVLNDGFGVLIRTTGNSGAISQFLTRLHTEAPPLSQIEGVETQVLSLLDYEDFHIAESISGENCTRVTPDAAICQACRAEVLDSTERRYGYPFANCTHCGPRFSIVKEVPLRSREHDDGRLPNVRRLQERILAASRPTLSRSTDCLRDLRANDLAGENECERDHR